MAFQVGTRVDPRLGALDFSGFTNAANVQAASLAQLGATIGGAIEERRENKKKKELDSLAQKVVFGYLKKEPQMASLFGVDPDNLTADDTKAFVDIMGAQPTLGMLFSLEAERIKANTRDRPTIQDITRLKELLAAEGDKIIQDGRIVDTTFRNEVVPISDPLVQQLLSTDVGRDQLYGYGQAELLETVDEPSPE